jgi:PPOX class probable F420-dependent enzyme
MQPDEARARFAAAQVARLATVGADGTPHLVPICFAVAGDRIVTAVDHKPKRTAQLRRLANIAANPSVSLLADHYEADDWSALWWVRADGTARVLAPGSPGTAAVVAALVERYPQYVAQPPAGPVIEIAVTRWSGWRAAGQA